MSQVYTFCKSGGTKTSSTPVTQSSNAPSSTETSATGCYSFKREEVKSDVPNKPEGFTEDDFPSLGGLTPVTKNIGSWGDSLKIGIIRESFPKQIVMPKKPTPPLFNKIKKTKQVVYDDYDEEDEEENSQYYESDSEEVPNTSYWNTNENDEF
jgi:hypothetical protein